MLGTSLEDISCCTNNLGTYLSSTQLENLGDSLHLDVGDSIILDDSLDDYKSTIHLDSPLNVADLEEHHPVCTSTPIKTDKFDQKDMVVYDFQNDTSMENQNNTTGGEISLDEESAEEINSSINIDFTTSNEIDTSCASLSGQVDIEKYHNITALPMKSTSHSGKYIEDSLFV